MLNPDRPLQIQTWLDAVAEDPHAVDKCLRICQEPEYRALREQLVHALHINETRHVVQTVPAQNDQLLQIVRDYHNLHQQSTAVGMRSILYRIANVETVVEEACQTSCGHDIDSIAANIIVQMAPILGQAVLFHIIPAERKLRELKRRSRLINRLYQNIIPGREIMANQAFIALLTNQAHLNNITLASTRLGPVCDNLITHINQPLSSRERERVQGILVKTLAQMHMSDAQRATALLDNLKQHGFTISDRQALNIVRQSKQLGLSARQLRRIITIVRHTCCNVAEERCEKEAFLGGRLAELRQTEGIYRPGIHYLSKNMLWMTAGVHARRQFDMRSPLQTNTIMRRTAGREHEPSAFACEIAALHQAGYTLRLHQNRWQFSPPEGPPTLRFDQLPYNMDLPHSRLRVLGHITAVLLEKDEIEQAIYSEKDQVVKRYTLLTERSIDANTLMARMQETLDELRIRYQDALPNPCSTVQLRAHIRSLTPRTKMHEHELQIFTDIKILFEYNLVRRTRPQTRQSLASTIKTIQREIEEESNQLTRAFRNRASRPRQNIYQRANALLRLIETLEQYHQALPEMLAQYKQRAQRIMEAIRPSDQTPDPEAQMALDAIVAQNIEDIANEIDAIRSNPTDTAPERLLHLIQVIDAMIRHEPSLRHNSAFQALKSGAETLQRTMMGGGGGGGGGPGEEQRAEDPMVGNAGGEPAGGPAAAENDEDFFQTKVQIMGTLAEITTLCNDLFNPARERSELTVKTMTKQRQKAQKLEKVIGFIRRFPQGVQDDDLKQACKQIQQLVDRATSYIKGPATSTTEHDRRHRRLEAAAAKTHKNPNHGHDS